MTLDHNATLRQADPTVARLIDAELRRQQHGLELIASENFASRAVIDAMGTPLTNKYAEGYPGRRYYGGCEVVDEVEQLAIDRLKQLFGAEHANVQPHSGAQANFAAFMAVIPPGEKIMGMSLPHGGHLSHGAAVNHSGRVWKAVHYGVDPATGRIDYDVVRRQDARVAHCGIECWCLAGCRSEQRTHVFASRHPVLEQRSPARYFRPDGLSTLLHPQADR